MKPDRKPCTFCQMVEYLTEKGMIDEYDRAIIAHHLEQEHATGRRAVSR